MLNTCSINAQQQHNNRTTNAHNMRQKIVLNAQRIHNKRRANAQEMH